MWCGDVGAREVHQRVHVSEQHGRIWTRFVLNVLNCAEIGNSEGLAERKAVSCNCHSIISSLGCAPEEKLKTSNLPCFLPGLQGPRKERYVQFQHKSEHSEQNGSNLARVGLKRVLAGALPVSQHQCATQRLVSMYQDLALCNYRIDWSDSVGLQSFLLKSLVWAEGGFRTKLREMDRAPFSTPSVARNTI